MCFHVCAVCGCAYVCPLYVRVVCVACVFFVYACVYICMIVCLSVYVSVVHLCVVCI